MAKISYSEFQASSKLDKSLLHGAPFRLTWICTVPHSKQFSCSPLVEDTCHWRYPHTKKLACFQTVYPISWWEIVWLTMAMTLATTGRLPEMGRELNEWPHQSHRLWASLPDAFWVYMFKVQLCTHTTCHEWTLCPYAHPGERARRRDPRRFRYLAVACPDYRLVRGMGVSSTCVRGLNCGYAHGVFELWMHPKRFRTRFCDAGRLCPRKVCFFAHDPAQRRREDDVVPPFVSTMPLLQPYFPPRLVPRAVDESTSASCVATLAVDFDNGSSSGESGSSSLQATKDSDSVVDELSDSDLLIVGMMNRLGLDLDY